MRVRDPRVLAASTVTLSRGVDEMSLRRVVLAFLFTPLVAPFYAAILFAQPWALPIGLSASYSSALLVGIPIFWLLRRRKWVGCSHLIFAGILCGALIVAAYSIGAPSADVEPFSVVGAATILAWSAFSGFCFWLLGIAGDAPVTLRTLLNPDLSTEERVSLDLENENYVSSPLQNNQTLDFLAPQSGDMESFVPWLSIQSTASSMKTVISEQANI